MNFSEPVHIDRPMNLWTIRQAAEFRKVDQKTIRNWLPHLVHIRTDIGVLVEVESVADYKPPRKPGRPQGGKDKNPNGRELRRLGMIE